MTDDEITMMRIQINHLRTRFQIVEDWDPTDEAICWKYISKHPKCIKWVQKPSVRLQRTAIETDIKAVVWIDQPDQQLLEHCLTNEYFIVVYAEWYDEWIQKIFKNNELMLKKFTRYASRTRDETKISA